MLNQKNLILGAVAVLALAGGLGWFWSVNGARELRFPGIVEIQEVRLGSKVGGRVFKVLVEEGDRVEPGQELVIFEVPELITQRDQVKARLAAARADWERAKNGPREEEIRAARAAADAAKAKYDRMKEGWREEEKRQAKSELDSALAEWKQANEDFARISELYRQKSAARAEYDAALSARDRAQGKVNAATAKFDMLKAGNRKEDIEEARAEFDKAAAKFDELYNGTRQEDKDLAKARWEETKAKLDELEVNIKEAVVDVPQNLGQVLVEVMAVRPGDIVPAGQPVVRVLRAMDMWVKIFVPETKYGDILEKMEVEVTIDTFPNKRFKGRVQQKANISEFTPRNVQSLDERRYQVFGVKIQVENPQGIFNAGMAAEVHIPLK